MKKVLLCALAVAAMTTACNRTEVVDVVGTPAIQVGNIFVENATKAAVDPSFTNDNLNELSLYGFMNTPSGVVFNNERLAKDITNTELTQAWKYGNTQYWTPGNTYYFGVVAPLVAENGPVAVDYSKANEYGIGTISFTQPTDAGSVDVLYDAKKVTCESMTMDPIAFEMNHMLAKVKFSFTNGFGNDNAFVTVKNIRMTAPAAGSINVAQQDWWSTNLWVLAEGETTLEFGDMETAKLAVGENTESAKERLTIPAAAEQVYNVTFDVELYYGDQLAYSNTLETVIEGAELKIGKAYNFHATIDGSNIVPGDEELNPIEFTVTVKDWEDGNGYDGGVIETTSDILPISSPEALAAALTADAADIKVKLLNDIEVPITSLGNQTPGSGEYKLGSENTKNITIDLNDKKLTITTTYWSGIGAKNADALIAIKNGTMTSSQATGTWNSYDLTFANCNYAIEDVDFEKAIAFTNEGKSVNIKNVTINETHDYYAMWISAEGQNVTIDGLTVESAGRGIKIDEQYVDTPAKVTLDIKNSTFVTTKKAAIMVKSVAGADITLNNIKLTDVKADIFNAVWVDADAAAYADEVTVTGGSKIIEGTPIIADGATIYLGTGNYVIPAEAKGKNITFVGTGNPEDVQVAVTKVGTGGENCDYGLDGSNVTFKNITITTNSSTYIGYARCNGTYINCIINGTYTLYGNSTFENCTFNVSGNVYNVWTWGAPTATFKNCTFNSDGKSMLLYGQANTKLTIEGCTFNDKGGLTDLKAAIEIGNDYNKSYELIVNNTTVNGYEINDKGINTGTTLWANKNSMTQEKLNVVVDGTDVY